MEMLVAHALKRCVGDWEQTASRRELLMPLGLVLLSRGWITRSELHAALEAQRCHGEGQLGEWLRRQGSVAADTIAKALGAQWNCPALVGTQGLEQDHALVPPILLRQYGLVLLRHSASARLYLAAKSRAEHAAAHALTRMLDTDVEAAFLEDSVWSLYSEREDAMPEVCLPHADGAAVQICRWIEQTRPRNARIVRVHDHLWLRMWGGRGRPDGAVEDKVLPLRTRGAASDGHGSLQFVRTH